MSSANFRAVFDRAPQALLILDAEGRLVFRNCAATELLSPLSDVEGNQLLAAFEAPDAHVIQRASTRPGERLEQRIRAHAPNGQRTIELTTTALEDGSTVVGLRDVTERERIVGSERSFRNLAAQSPDGIGAHRGGAFVYANRALAHLLGYDQPQDLVGENVARHVHPDDRTAIAERARALDRGDNAVPFKEERLVRRDGVEVFVSIAGMSVDFEGVPTTVVIVRDVTEKRHFEQQIIQAERMASLGALSAGVAHEINNPLTYLILRLDIMASLADRAGKIVPLLDDPARALESKGLLVPLLAELGGHVATAKEGAQRVRSIVHDLRTFARADDDAALPLDVHAAIELAIGIARHELKQRAKLERDYTTNAVVLGGEGKLAQVFLHILRNAIDSIPRGDPDGNVIRVATRVVGDDVTVTVEDTGVGIAPENLARVFEPFFSTKKVGEGSGLGLSICHGIVTSLGGRIHVEARSQNTGATGATLVVTLPSARTFRESAPPADPPVP